MPCACCGAPGASRRQPSASSRSELAPTPRCSRSSMPFCWSHCPTRKPERIIQLVTSSRSVRGCAGRFHPEVQHLAGRDAAAGRPHRRLSGERSGREPHRRRSPGAPASDARLGRLLRCLWSGDPLRANVLARRRSAKWISRRRPQPWTMGAPLRQSTRHRRPHDPAWRRAA